MAEDLFEYNWPLDSAERFMLQEQVGEFIRLYGFKRKYPDLVRRSLYVEEKIWLRDKVSSTNLVSKSLIFSNFDGRYLA